MATPTVTQPFSSIAGGITDLSAQTQVSTLADPPTSEVPHTAPTGPPVGEESATPPKRRAGRPKGSKNKSTLGLEVGTNGAPEKRPVGRPRGSGKKRTESDTAQTKRPVGRPRKDGLPPGSASKPAYSTLVPPPSSDYYRITNSNAPIHQWVPAFPGSIPTAMSAVDPALRRNEWAELANSKPDDFLHVLLAALDVPNPASVTGPSLEDAFKSHLGSLALPPSSAVNAANRAAPAPATAPTIPSLYSILKTFWLPSSPSYFALTASATSSRTPSPYRFLYWDPQPLVFNGIACPTCSAPLANRGRIRSGPLTIHDLSGPFFIIGCAYTCAAGHAFASTDASVRRALPPALEREFPARLLAGDTGVGEDVWSWQARGVSRALWNLVLGALRAGLSRDVIQQLVRDVQLGVPESASTAPKEERTQDAVQAEDEEEGATDDAVGEGESPAGGDAVMAPPEPGPATETSAAQAFNDAWTANSVAATSGGALPAELRNNPYARLALPMFQPVPTIIAYDPASGAARKRPYPFGDAGGAHMDVSASAASGTDAGGSAGTGAIGAKPRNPRHCCKCGSQTCKGKGGRNFCTSACMDCGKFDCRGRNSRRPDKRCDSAGWPVTESDPQPQPAPQLEPLPQLAQQSTVI
ncbi:hypothetical protein GGX14DRAFT_586555 [Mycena pura]|uniref:Uncharacterized protein n=1 Tax=Mycena pura TaxID=153505 RepID=A0AAD6YGI5_9AGAR|nr:hypothetical protein GGX14DRAFT_586555 [Mycena pura]